MTTKLKALQRAIRRLDGTADRPIARRNARKRVLAALRAVRAQVDCDFPALTVARKQRRKGLRAALTYPERQRILLKRGLRAVSGDSAAKYASAGVRVLVVKDVAYAPTWATAIGPNDPAQLRAAKKSVKLRRAALAAQALAQG